jgi:hypothetical protein
MKLRHIAVVAFACIAAGLAVAPQRANAAATVLCAPTVPDAASARRVVNPNNAAQTIGNGIYQLNGQGCAIVCQSDVGYFLNQGFSPGAPFGA